MWRTKRFVQRGNGSRVMTYQGRHGYRYFSPSRRGRGETCRDRGEVKAYGEKGKGCEERPSGEVTLNSRVLRKHDDKRETVEL